MKKKTVQTVPAAAFLFVLLTVFDKSLLCASVLLAAGVHELGHLLAAKLLHVRMDVLRLDFMGMRLDASGRLLTYGEEWTLCAAGPIFSLLFSAVLAPLWGMSFFWAQTSCASLLLGVLNLCPVKGFDGGNMLCSALSCAGGERLGEGVLRWTSILFVLLLWGVAVYFLLKVGDGLSLFCFSMGLFSRLFDAS
jgi:Zn-dependent protease